jgi:polyhydroxybutyrate depolymerase
MNSFFKKTIVFILVLLNFFAIAQSGVTHIDSILSGGLMRKYRLYVPNSYNYSNPTPLVFNLHGYTSNASQQEAYANFMPIADTAKFLVLSPDGTAQFGNQFWNAGFGTGPNDVQFISDLIDSVKLTYNVDLNSVYSCGMSNGGIMSYYLACNLPNRIAAIASVTGSMLNSWYTCAPPRPFPLMQIHGTLDGTVPYNGDVTFAPIDSVVKKWRVHNSCIASPITFSVPNTSLTDNSTAVNYKYTGGTNSSSVELYKVTGGSHSWPGALPIISNTNQDFKASVEIWRFFRQYKLNQFVPNVGIAINSKVDDEIVIYPNPTSDSFSFKSKTSKIFEVEIINDLGQKVDFNFTKKEDSILIDIKNLPLGIYFVKISNEKSLVFKKVVKS